MRKFRLQPLVAFRARTRLLRVVGGSSSFGVADKQLALAGRLTRLGVGFALTPLFTQHEKTRKLKGVLAIATVLLLAVIGLFCVDMHRAGASNSRAENIQ